MASPEDIVKRIEENFCEEDLIKALSEFFIETGGPSEAVSMFAAAVRAALAQIPEAELVEGLLNIAKTRAFLDPIKPFHEEYDAVMKDPTLSFRVANAVARVILGNSACRCRDDIDGYVALVKRLIASGDLSTKNASTALHEVCKKGSLEVAKVLAHTFPDEYGNDIRCRPLEAAYGSGRLDLVKWVCGVFYPKELDVDEFLCAASNHDYPAILEWLATQYTDLAPDKNYFDGDDAILAALSTASKNGYLGVVVWLCKNFGARLNGYKTMEAFQSRARMVIWTSPSAWGSSIWTSERIGSLKRL